MVIYGVALLAICSLLGLIIGDGLGMLLGVKANVGGVGFAMILLMIGTGWLSKRGKFKPTSSSGIAFWSSMYLPIVVAMAAQQNVYGAIKGGPLAIAAGTAAVLATFALVPALARIGQPKPDDSAEANSRKEKEQP
jgi:malonate transporter MadL subunit